MSGFYGKADVGKAGSLAVLVAEGYVVKGDSRAVLFRGNVFFLVIHGRTDFQNAGHTLGAGGGFVQGDDQGSQFDELHDHLSHVVVESNDFTLLHVSEVYLHTGFLDQEDGGDVDEHIGCRIEESGDPSDKLIQFGEVPVAGVKLFYGLLFPAEGADDADASEVFTGQTGNGVQTALHFFEKRDADIHDNEGHQEKDRDRNHENQGAADVDCEGHDHGTENDEGASKKQAKTHVQSVLDLVHIISQTGNQGVCSEGIQLGK